MISVRSIYREMYANDATCQLLLSVASLGEEQGGWENERIADLTRDPEFAAKIWRHGQDEVKHGRLFLALLRKRGLERASVPLTANYTMLLERSGIGLTHSRLREDRALSDAELIVYLAHSRVTEQRASDEIARQVKIFGDDPEFGKALRIIAEDEANHLDYAQEELLRFCNQGHVDEIRRLVGRYALAESRVHRAVALDITRRVGRALGWSTVKRVVLRVGIHVGYWCERLWGWRRAARLQAPARTNVMAPRENQRRPEGATG